VPRPHQQRQIDGDADTHQHAADGLALAAHQAEAHHVIDGGAGGDQEDVEEAVARQEQEVGRQNDGQPGEARPAHPQYRKKTVTRKMK